MTFRNIAYGFTHEAILDACQTGFSGNSDTAQPNMTTLMKHRQTELWANNKVPYYVSYAKNGVCIYPDDRGLGWKRREYIVSDEFEAGCEHRVRSPATFESTRFKFSRSELNTTKLRREAATSRRSTAHS